MKKRYLNRLLSACLAASLSLSILPFVALAEGEELSYFESFDGESRADVIHGTPAPTTVVIDSEGHGDVLHIDVKAVASSPYFLWVNKDHKWKLTDVTVHEDGTVSGVANGITVTRAVVNRNKLDASTLFTLEGVNYYVVTGEYVDAVAGGVNTIVPAKLKMPAFPYVEGKNVVFSCELYLSTDFSHPSGISSRTSSSAGNIELFEIKGDGEKTYFSCHENGKNLTGDAKEISRGEWHTVSITVDAVSARRVVYLDGEFLAVQSNANKSFPASPVTFNQNGWAFQVDRGSTPNTLNGYFEIDNVSISYVENDNFLLYTNDFEGETVGSAPTQRFSSVSVLSSTVSDAYGTKAWSIPVTEENIDKNPKIMHTEIPALQFSKVVYESDLFIPTGTYGRLQSQVLKPLAYADANATEATLLDTGWTDLFVVYMEEGKAPRLCAESYRIQDSALLENDRWNRISVVIDLKTCVREVYLNGDLVFSATFYLNHPEAHDMTIVENSFILAGKINKNQPKNEGSFQIDNVRIFVGDAPSVAPASERPETFESYAFIEGLPMNVLSAPTSAKIAPVENGYALYMALAETAEEDYAPFKYKHAAFDFESAERVMLEADYFLEAGACGTVESRHADGASPLYVIDAATGRVEGTGICLSVGEWNNLKTVLNLRTGAYTLYVNGVLAKTGAVGATELSVGTSAETAWTVAEVIPAEEATGGIYIDNLLLTDAVAESVSTVSDAFLTDEAFYSYMEGIVKTVDGASIRMSDPTGLRFAARIDAEKLSHLQAILGEDVLTGGGVVITPRDYAERAGGWTRDALDTLENEVNYLDIRHAGIFFDGAKAGLEEGLYLSGAIVSLKEENVARAFIGSAYVEITVGENTYTFTTATATERSAREVAASALADEHAQWTDAQRAILSSYAGTAQEN